MKIERTIKDLDYPTIKQLSKHLQISEAKAKLKIDVLLEENKILMDGKRIVWIHNPKLNKLLKSKGYEKL